MAPVPDIDNAVRDAVVFQLRVGDAHQTFDDAVSDFPMDAINVRPPNVGYTFWHLVEHVRFCQADMLDYMRHPDYRAVTFPDDYWPDPQAMATTQRWDDTLEAYRRDLDEVEAFVRDAGTDLLLAPPHAWEPGHTPLRTVLVMADHAAYHGGEIGILRQVLGLWSAERVDRFTIEAKVTQNRTERT